MQRLTYTNNRGESVTFSKSRPFILSHIDGVGGASVEIRSTRAPFQDGSSVSGVQLNDRSVSIQGAIMANSQDELYALRRQISRVMNPKAAGSLVYSNDSRSYAAQAIAEEGPIWGERHKNNQVFSVSFLCPDPFWQDENQIVRELRFEDGGLSFPLRLPSMFSFAGYRGTFSNDGDVETPVIIRYQGPAVNPVVLNETTGEFIRVNRTLTTDDILHINTAFGQVRVEIIAANGDRQNVFQWIDPDSTFFKLVIGKNTLTYSGDNENFQQIAQVTIYWKNKYAGG